MDEPGVEPSSGGGRSSGRVALVSGGGSGIGRATIFELASRSYAVGILDRAEDAAEAAAAEVEKRGGSAHVAVGDVSSAEQVEAAVAGTVSAFGRLDVAVACAGVEALGKVTSMHLAEWKRAFAVNVDGVMHLARYAIPAMGTAGGAFIAISSDAGVLGARGCAPYVASKHAVIGLVRSLALDYGRHGIRSNVVAPAFVETAMADRFFEGFEGERPKYEDVVPMGRFATPEEVAQVVAHLASAESSYTNGHVYMVDGGETAGLFI
ncbi:MAG: SDR family NAD(P)-dependent oxidoreductase [Solirubrobacterales bacterium]